MMERNLYVSQRRSVLLKKSEPKTLFANSLLSLSLIKDLRGLRSILNVGRCLKLACLFTGRSQGYFKFFNLSRIVVRSSTPSLNGLRKL